MQMRLHKNVLAKKDILKMLMDTVAIVTINVKLAIKITA